MKVWHSVLPLLWLLGCNQTVWKQQASSQTGVLNCELTYENVEPIFSTHCISCHSQASPTAKLALDSYDSVRAASSRVLARIGNGTMPPEGSDAVTSEEKATLEKWVAGGMPLDTSQCENPPPPPPTCEEGKPLVRPLRRLTLRQYTNTIRDLFGTELFQRPAFQAALATLPPEPTDLAFESMVGGISSQGVDGLFLTANTLAEIVTEKEETTIALLPCWTATPEIGCLQKFIRDFGRKAWRRPLSQEEQKQWEGLYEEGASMQSPLSGLRRVLAGFLQSPNFLYLLEIQGTPLEKENALALNPYEIASRLSYTYLGSLPDEGLFAQAESGALGDAEVIKSEANRLWRLPASKANFQAFFEQWLRLRTPSLNYSPDYLNGTVTEGLRKDLMDELKWYFQYHLRGEGKSYSREKPGTLAALLTSRISYVSPVLAALYGISESGRVLLPAGEREGLLTRAGLMATGSNQTLPFRRGSRLLLSALTCQDLHRPDPTTLPPAALNDPPLSTTLSTRERFEQITDQPACLSCHRHINAMAWPFEKLDALGRVRTVERLFSAEGVFVGTAALNTSSSIFLDDKFHAVSSPSEVGHVFAQSKMVHRCFSQQWFRSAFGRRESEEDRCAIDRLEENLSKDGGTMKEMFLGLASSPGFRSKKLED